MKSIKFRLYCDKEKTQYYKCIIFPDLKSMYKWNEKDGYKQDGEYKYLGLVRSYSVIEIPSEKEGLKGKIEKVSGEIGSISLVPHGCTSGVVSHEMTHAALYWFSKNHGSYKKLEKSKYDEMMAWVQGNLVSQFWTKWYELEEKGKIESVKITNV